ncbi:hypothetical protein [Sphingomicrobium sediminis]|uniref:Lipopolysaccharide assembly protein A domain-containing protein n=1 Tax=Sphingomicrobium sediminis TaxID=2950949 RepID=A0A9X2J3I5_9SPHN|nr:hypothetical protein [Sphingomicrobium sediminis]MCM8557336.1 hypothetical protein [Sphingomicrobium sediminis]
MRFLNTLLWILLAVALAVFATANWHDVMIDLWGDMRMAIKLPLLLAVAFGLGLVPTLVYYRAKVWRIERRLKQSERNLAAHPTTPPPPSAPARERPVEPDSPF